MKRKKRRILVIGGIVVTVLLIVVVSTALNRPELVSVQTTEVRRVPSLISKVNATGEIKPKEFVELQAEISGVITELFVEEGDFVQLGDLLLRIDPTQSATEVRAQRAALEASRLEAGNQLSQITLQQSNLAREKANVRAAEAEVLRARQSLIISENNYTRQQNLFEEDLISRDLYEAARNEKVAAEAALATAEARLEQAQASLAVSEVVLEQTKNSYQTALRRAEQSEAALDRASDSLSKTTIRSPLTGVITQLNVEVGERAVPGTLNNPAATIMVIADLSVIEAEVEVDETDIVDVILEQPAEVNVDALPEQPLEGVVTEVGNSAIVKPNTQEAKDFKVAIRLFEPPKSLRPGLSCTADITTATRQEVLTIPIQALAVREFATDAEGNPIITDETKPEEKPSSEDRESRADFQGVFALVDGKAQFKTVKTGIDGGTELEIVSGLSEGDEIIMGPYRALRNLKNGERVKVENEAKG